MDSPAHDPLPLRKALIGKLVKGKESATQLQTLIQKPCGPSELVLTRKLALEVTASFSESLSLLTESAAGEIDINELAQIAAADGAKRVSPVDRSSKGSDHGKKRAGVKDRRGCYRRRNSAQSRVKVSPTTEDGFAWRKYGQKEILNTKFPRCYFRCTHKHDQSCKATKQVQRIKEDPQAYQITYFGHHTCQTTLMRTSPIISELPADPMDSCLLSFETTTATSRVPNIPRQMMISRSSVEQQVLNHHHHHRQEVIKDETQISDVTTDNKSSSCLGSSMWHDMTTDQSRRILDQEVISNFHSCSSGSTPLQDLEMDAFATKFPDLDNDLYMDDDHHMGGFNLHFTN